jgi:hypothetical protein
MKKFILVIILILLILYLLKNYSELKNMEHYTILKNDNTQILSSTLPNVNTRQGTDPLDGQLFEDVLLYQGDNTLEGDLGLEKCIKKCKGMCVEYGMTGDAYCYPEEYLEVKNKYLESINSELKARPLD